MEPGNSPRGASTIRCTRCGRCGTAPGSLGHECYRGYCHSFNHRTGVIGPGFAGLSYEKSQMANPFFSPGNTDAIGLFKLIGPSLLRIGGNSVDKTTWMPNGAGRTSGQVAPSDIDALAGFLKATGWQVFTELIWRNPLRRWRPRRSLTQCSPRALPLRHRNRQRSRPVCR